MKAISGRDIEVWERHGFHELTRIYIGRARHSVRAVGIVYDADVSPCPAAGRGLPALPAEADCGYTTGRTESQRARGVKPDALVAGSGKNKRRDAEGAERRREFFLLVAHPRLCSSPSLFWTSIKIIFISSPPKPFQFAPVIFLCPRLRAGGRGWGRRFCRSRPAGRDAPARRPSRPAPWRFP